MTQEREFVYSEETKVDMANSFTIFTIQVSVIRNSRRSLSFSTRSKFNEFSVYTEYGEISGKYLGSILYQLPLRPDNFSTFQL